jgi:hypothetical protein
MHVIGEESSQRLDVIPAQFRVIVTHRPKYACRACAEAGCQIRLASPLCRQAQMLVAQGLDIKLAILAFLVGYAAAELKPLYVRLRELILTSGKSWWTRRWRRCSTLAAAAPSRDTSGLLRGLTDRGAGPIHLPSPTATPQVADLCTRQAARPLLRHRAMRRLCRLQEHCQRAYR